MFIKEVHISGFRSYRDLTKIDNFSKGHNVVVGRNGSGKSNFFFAIQFVLSEEFAHLKQDVRLGMLHEGTGPRIQAARVEIVFDNTDRRIVANDTNEVRVVRQIGSKKDQYYIDGKVVTRADVVNLLESAGISRSNPYFIVKQGKINELATAPDEYRLKLLREVAGTRVYDERKEESEKILEETKQKQQKIDSLLSFIEDRLKSLEEEKNDLKEYQKWDKDKRSIEYTIYEAEIKESRDRLEALAQEREDLHKLQNDLASTLVDVQTRALNAQTDKRKLDARFKGVRDEKESLMGEREERLKKKAELELGINDLQDDVSRERSSKSSARDQLAAVEREIEGCNEQLGQIVPEFEQLSNNEATLASDMRIAETRCKELFAKQGHGRSFNTKEQRDEYLRKELSRLRNKLGATKELLQNLEKAIEEDTQEEERIANEQKDVIIEINDKATALQKDGEEQNKTRKKLEEATRLQMEAAREEKSVRESINGFDVDIQNLEQAEKQVGNRAHIMGVDGMRKVVEELRERNDRASNELLHGYHGTLMDHINCDDMYFQAVEAAAGNKMYNIIVDTDRQAQKFLEHFNKMHLPGEVNFLPMNRMGGHQRKDVEDEEARHMLDVLDYPDHLEGCFNYAFGKTAIIRRLEIGGRICRQFQVNCVTLEGDQVARSGTMTGGFMDAKKSKLDVRKKLTVQRQKREEVYASLQSKSDEAKRRLVEIDRIRETVNQLDIGMRAHKDRYRFLESKKKELMEAGQQIIREREIKKQQQRNESNRVREFEAEIQHMEDELGHELESQLNTQESDEIGRLQREIKEKRKELEGVSKKRTELESKKNRMQNLLNTKYMRQKEELERKVNDIAMGEKQHRLSAESEEFQGVNRRLSEINKRLAEIEDEMVDYDTENDRLQREIEDMQDQQRDREARIAEFSKQADAIVTKQSTLQTKKEEASKKARELGTLPADAFSRYKNLSRNQLDKRLAECMKELKKYENVNKKALDQFVQASQQKEDLEKRLKEQGDNEKSIRDLIDVLDHRKYDAMQLTFKQVTKNFMTVFAKLVPLGHGELVWKAEKDSSNDSGNDTRNEIDKFTGIGINISFGGQEGTREMKQLSGGQKSLVALALIFAIQKCDPAPFYLFDEIDAALDAQHRKAVADMIHELSANAQFITTTFRSELLEHAEKCYGVIFRSKVSHITEIHKSSAYDFVEDDATHG